MINKIFIILGNSCNLNCKYCVQHQLVHRHIKSKINEDIYSFIRIISKYKKLPIVFFGGEPLLYYPAIKEIINKTKQYDVSYHIITNGLLLNREVITFFNLNKVGVAVSWDGNNTEQTRRYNIFKDINKIKSIIRLDSLSLSGVVTSYSYPKDILDSFQTIDNWYFQLHNKHIGVNLDLLIDTGLSDRDLYQFDFKKLEEQSRYIIMQFIKDYTEKKETIYYLYGLSLLNRLLFSLKNPFTFEKCTCGNGHTVINLDLSGNLYSCHNISNSNGTIYDLENNLNLNKETDPTSDFKDFCKECKALPFCRGGCPLVTKERKEDFYCKIRQTYFGSILEEITKNKNFLEELTFNSR